MSIGLTVTRRLLGSGVVVQLPSVWRGRDLAPHQLSMKCRRILTGGVKNFTLFFYFEGFPKGCLKGGRLVS